MNIGVYLTRSDFCWAKSAHFNYKDLDYGECFPGGKFVWDSHSDVLKKGKKSGEIAFESVPIF